MFYMECSFRVHLIIRKQHVELKRNAMNTKKSPIVSLENKKGLYFEIGLTIALAVSLVAFEWATPETGKSVLAYEDEGFDIEEVQTPVTRSKPEVKMKPPVMPKIEIVPDNIEIPDDPIDFTSEADPGEIVIWDPPEEPPVGTDPVVIIADQMPRYRGGELIEFRKHMQEIVDYPQRAIDLDLQGKVFLRFVVDKEGNLTDIEIIKGIDPILDQAVLEALQKSERWEPGRQAGRKVKVAMSMPIVFRLEQ